MNNIQFIKKYGKQEFIDICKNINHDLEIAKFMKEICCYKINKIQKNVKFYINGKGCITLDFASIYAIGIFNLKKYLKGVDIENEKS